MREPVMMMSLVCDTASPWEEVDGIGCASTGPEGGCACGSGDCVSCANAGVPYAAAPTSKVVASSRWRRLVLIVIPLFSARRVFCAHTGASVPALRRENKRHSTNEVAFLNRCVAETTYAKA